VARLGLPGVAAGRGTRIQYSRAQASQWLVALLLAEVGVDPTVIVRAIKANWERLLPSVKEATDRTAIRDANPIFLALRPRLMSAGWEDNSGFVIFMFRRFDPFPIRPVDRDMLPALIDSDQDNWMCVLNFTRPANQLELALR
jgi:hypothetical protein